MLNMSLYRKAINILLYVIVLLPFILFLFLPLFYASFNISYIYIMNFFASSVKVELLTIALKNSLIQAILSTAISIMIGFPVGILFGIYDFPGKKFAVSLSFLAFFMPSILMVFGYIELFYSMKLYNFYGLWSIILVNVTFNAPVVAIFTSASLDALPVELIYSAKLLKAKWYKNLKDLYLPFSYRGLFLGALITFLYSFMGFTAPLMIGGVRNYTLEVWIYSLFKTFLDYRGAIFLSIIQIGILIIPAYLYFLLTETGSVVSERNLKKLRIEFSNFKNGAAVTAILSAYIIFISIPVYELMYHSFLNGNQLSYSMYIKLFQKSTEYHLDISYTNVIINTLFFSSLSTIITIALSLLIVYIGREKFWLRFSTVIPLIVSPIVLALSDYLFYLNLFINVWPIIVITQVVISLPITARIVDNGIKNIPDCYENAARLLNAKSTEIFFRIKMPIMKYSLTMAALISFAMGMGNFASTLFIYTPQYTTIPISIYDFEQLKLYNLAYASSGILLIITFLSFYIIYNGENLW